MPSAIELPISSTSNAIVSESTAVHDTDGKNRTAGTDNIITGKIISDDRNLTAPTTDAFSKTLITTTATTSQGKAKNKKIKTINIQPRLRQNLSKWNSDEVLRWFQHNKLDELHDVFCELHENMDGKTLEQIYQSKRDNRDSYVAEYTPHLQLDQKNLSKDFLRFGHLLDEHFIDKYSYRFDVAVSFPGDKREEVQRIVEKLCVKIKRKGGKHRIFYDNYHKAELARPNLDLYLQNIYRYQSRLIVIFMCADYMHKEWCCLEARAMRSLLKTHQSERIMLLTFDGSMIEGILDIDGYLNISNKNPSYVANQIYRRLKVLDKPLSTSKSSRPLPSSTENKKWTLISFLKNASTSSLVWIIIVAFVACIIGVVIGRSMMR